VPLGSAAEEVVSIHQALTLHLVDSHPPQPLQHSEAVVDAEQCSAGEADH
jgi:hypothetical protein